MGVSKAFSSLVLALVAFAAAETADAYVELNVFYGSDTLATDASVTSTRTFLEGAVGFAIDKKGDYNVGWNYSMFTTADAGTSTTTYSSTQMGPRFLFMLDKAHHWTFGLGYYLVTTGTYTPGGGTAQTWKGTALKADLGYGFDLSDMWVLGIRLNYSSATYSESLTNDTDYAKVSYASSLIYPSIYTMLTF